MTYAFPEPDVFLPGSGEPGLRWGVLAPGRIASSFVEAVHRHTRQRFVAVGSRSQERAAAFAQRHGVERAYGTYERLVEDPDVDVVYVAAPASEHLSLGLLSIRAGKHVVIEKPLATTASEAADLVRAARQRRVFLMEAMWSRYLPQASVIRKLVDDGALGDVHAVLADFCMATDPDRNHRLHRADLGGGALLDVGIYSVQFSSMVAGAPSQITAVGDLGSTGVDVSSRAVLRHPNGVMSTIISSIAERSPSRAYIAGSQGRIELDGPFHVPSGIGFGTSETAAPLHRWEDQTGVRMFDALSWEATAAAGFIGEGRVESPLHSHSETIQILGTIDEIRRQVADAGVHA